jgi:acetyl-CoA carboxylase biotin carboxyl carrier protein
MKIDDKAIRKLADLLEETGLGEIEVVEGEQVIRVSKNSVTNASRGEIAAAAPSAESMPSEPTIPQAANMDAPATTAQEQPGAVVSPMVGTAYMQPEPNAPSFVQKGTSVQSGDTLMIIEAMKVLNPIKAEKPGTVTQILIEDGQPVEFGDVLMVIE